MPGDAEVQGRVGRSGLEEGEEEDVEASSVSGEGGEEPEGKVAEVGVAWVVGGAWWAGLAWAGRPP